MSNIFPRLHYNADYIILNLWDHLVHTETIGLHKQVQGSRAAVFLIWSWADWNQTGVLL